MATTALMRRLVAEIPRERPVLIAGPTASGKSALAAAIAETGGGVIINADALQVFSDWRILTARPSLAEEAARPHRLYGHVPGDRAYSVGHWIRDLAPCLAEGRAIIVGGTGLYFAALTEGLAEIPEVPCEIRDEALERLADTGPQALVDELDPPTRARIDVQNPIRVQRAWEVLRATGRGLAEWQDRSASPLLPLGGAEALCLNAPPAWLEPRIVRRFRTMMHGGLLDEARWLRPVWTPNRPSSKAIGAREVMAYLKGDIDESALEDAIVVKTRQYAKRQRSWFRGRMSAWRWIDPDW